MCQSAKAAAMRLLSFQGATDVQAMLGCCLLVKTEAGIEFPYDAVKVEFLLKAA